MSPRRVLVVDDEKLIRWSLSERLRSDGFDVVEAATVAEALERSPGVDVAVLDYSLPDGDGVALLRKLREADPELVALMLTANARIETVVDAMRAGAFDYATKPFDLTEMSHRVARAFETTRLRREVGRLRESLSGPYTVSSILGESEAMQRVKTLVRKVATSPSSTVLITGESGTGKDLIAKVVHYSSLRAARPFLNITCSALPETLLESELFGHERGAFTDARQQKRGLLEQADEGSVFLDEIAEMTPALQAKFLRFLEEKAFRRVGGSGDIAVDVRIIAATNRDLETLVREGAFREDLYYRLNVLRIAVPPLRAREDDVLELARAFVQMFAREFSRAPRAISPAVMTMFTSHAWPGNIRELRNLIERAMLLSETDTLTPADFDSLRTSPAGKGSGGFELPPQGLDLESLEQSLVVQALERTGGNQTRAATLLGLHRDQIRYRIGKFGLKDAPG